MVQQIGICLSVLFPHSFSSDYSFHFKDGVISQTSVHSPRVKTSDGLRAMCGRNTLQGKTVCPEGLRLECHQQTQPREVERLHSVSWSAGCSVASLCTFSCGVAWE